MSGCCVMLMLMLGGGWCLGLKRGESKWRNKEGRERKEQK